MSSIHAGHIALLALALGTAAGCDRTHLAPRYGLAVRRALAGQVIDPQAAQRARPEPGLDREESAVVLETYRRSLSPTKESAAARQSPVLVLPPAATAPYPSPEPGR